jgi:hypothetical protein
MLVLFQRSSRPSRTIVKKTKKQTGTSQRKVVKSQRRSSESNITEGGDQEENEVGQNHSAENTMDGQKEDATVQLVEEQQLDGDAEELTTSVRVEKRTDNETLREAVSAGEEDSPDQELIGEQSSDVLGDKYEGVNETETKESLAGTVRCSSFFFFHRSYIK